MVGNTSFNDRRLQVGISGALCFDWKTKGVPACEFRVVGLSSLTSNLGSTLPGSHGTNASTRTAKAYALLFCTGKESPAKGAEEVELANVVDLGIHPSPQPGDRTPGSSTNTK